MVYKIQIALIVLVISGCGSSYHLRRANHHIKKAEEKGATFHSDTAYKKVSFHVDGIKVKYEPRVVETGKVMVFTKDSVITKVKIIDGPGIRDTIEVATDCPDRVITKIIPVKVSNEIKSKGVSWWVYFLIGVIGVSVGYVLRSKREISIHLDKT